MSILRGAAWMVAFRWVDRGLGFISTLILARLLLPQDFGLVAMAMSVLALLELMGNFGFDVALIQNRQAERRHYDTAWTFAVLFGLAFALLLLVLARPASAFYEDPRLVGIMQVLAIGAVAQGLSNVGVVAFRKNMTFSKEFAFLFAKRVVMFVTTLVMAFTLRSYWALVIGIVTGRIAGCVLSYLMHHYRPRLSLDGGSELMHFSKWLLINNIINFAHTRSTDFILGKLGGARALGVYNIGYEIATLPTQELVAPVNRAAMPGYSQLSGDMPKLRAVFLDTIGLIMLLTLPMGLGLAAVAKPAVGVLLGDNWREASPLIEILAVHGTVGALLSNINQVFLAMGRPRVITYVNGGVLVLLLPTLVWAVSKYGAVGAAWTLLCYSIASTPLVYLVFFKVTGVSIAAYARTLWRPLLATVVMYSAVKLLSVNLVTTSELVQLICLIATGAIAYISIIYMTWKLSGSPRGAERLVLQNLSEIRVRLLRARDTQS